MVFQSLAISGFCQEQAHFLSLPAHRGLMGENVKDDHVPGIRVKPFQRHNVMPCQLRRPGLLPGLRQHFPNGPRLIRQMVICLDLPDHVHTLPVRERAQLLQEAFRRVLRGLAFRIAPGHVNLIQGGVLIGAFNLIHHPLFFFIQFHQSGSFPKMGVKKRHRFFIPMAWGTGKGC